MSDNRDRGSMDEKTNSTYLKFNYHKKYYKSYVIKTGLATTSVLSLIPNEILKCETNYLSSKSIIFIFNDYRVCYSLLSMNKMIIRLDVPLISSIMLPLRDHRLTCHQYYIGMSYPLFIIYNYSTYGY